MGQRPPGLCQRLGQRGFVSLELRCPVACSSRLDQHDLRLVTEQVGEDQRIVHEPCEPGLHPVEPLAVGQAVPVGAAPWLALHELTSAFTDLVARHELPATEHDCPLERLHRSLVTRIESGEPVDLVSPEVDTHGEFRRGREHVDDPTADGHLAHVLDLVFAPVTHLHQASDQPVLVDPVAARHRDRACCIQARRHDLKQRSHWGYHYGRGVRSRGRGEGIGSGNVVAVLLGTPLLCASGRRAGDRSQSPEDP